MFPAFCEKSKVLSVTATGFLNLNFRNHLNFRNCVCFRQGVPWHLDNFRVKIQSETCMWHNNIQSKIVSYFFNYQKHCCSFTSIKPVNEITLLHCISIVCIGVSTPPLKHQSLFLAKPPLKSANCPSPSSFGQSPPLHLFFETPLPPPPPPSPQPYLIF